MALIKCPECGKEISDKSDKCIHCGFPLRSTPLLQENINGKYYDVTFLKDTNIPFINKIKQLNELTNCGLVQAKEIAHKYHIIQESSKPKEENNRPKCPNCHSTNIKAITGTERVMSIMGLGIFSKKINKSFKCLNCKYTW